MRKVDKETGSKRRLTKRHLIVDWSGYGTLFYYMTRTQMRNALKSHVAQVKQQRKMMGFSTNSIQSFFVTYGHGMSIGCEYFTPKEVKELKVWAGIKEEKRESKSNKKRG